MALLRPPRLRTGRAEGHRAASWLELFFDLVLVVAIAQLAVTLADEATVAGFGRFLLLFTPVWWAWLGYTMYADRFDTDDLAFRGLTLVGMFGMVALAVDIPGAFRGGSAAFALPYAAVRAILILLYARAWRHVPAARPLCAVSIGAFLAGTALWLVSLLVPEPARFGLWVAALALEGLTPWVARRAMAGTPVHASHLPERHALFTIVVLGESLVAVVVGLGGTEWHARPALAAGLGFLVATALWWIYFTPGATIDIGRSLLARNIFIYGHLPIALGLTTVGVGVKKAIRYAADPTLPPAAVWLLGGGGALVLLALALIRAVAGGTGCDGVVALRAATAGVALLVAVVGAALPPLAPVGLLAAALVALAGTETLAVERHALAAAAPPPAANAPTGQG